MSDPYRTKAEPAPAPHPPREPWSRTTWFGIGTYAFLWALALVCQSADWSAWRTGAGILLAIHLFVCGFLFFEKVTS